MGTIFKISVRNLFRHKRRTILTALVISFGLVFLIWMGSVLKGMDRLSFENMINLSTSSMKIYTEKYDDEKDAAPLKNGITNYEEIKEKLLSYDGVESVARRTMFVGELSYEEYDYIYGNIVEPDEDKTTFAISDYIMEGGTYFTDEDGLDDVYEIIIGVELAKSLATGDDNIIPVGEYITLKSRSRYEANNALDFKLVGIMNTTDPSINQSGVYITYKAASELLDLEGLVTEIDVKSTWDSGMTINKYADKVNIIKENFNADFAGLGLVGYTFVDLSDGYYEMMKIKSVFTNLLSFIILLIAAVGIVNSVLMSVYERIREIGVLRAMGMGGSDVMLMFFFEGFVIGFIGSVFGLILGALVNIPTVYIGIDLVGMMRGYENADLTALPFLGVLYGTWNIESFIMAFGFGMLFTIVASIIPARNATKFEVTKCLRFN